MAMTADKPLTLDQVGDRFGKSHKWMKNNISRLRRDHGFPNRIPGFGNAYDPLAIEQWLAKQREPKSDVVTGSTAVVVETDWAAILDARAAALAPAAGHA